MMKLTKAEREFVLQRPFLCPAGISTALEAEIAKRMNPPPPPPEAVLPRHLGPLMQAKREAKLARQERVAAHHAEGLDIRETAAALGCGASTVSGDLREMGLPPHRSSFDQRQAQERQRRMAYVRDHWAMSDADLVAELGCVPSTIKRYRQDIMASKLEAAE